MAEHSSAISIYSKTTYLKTLYLNQALTAVSEERVFVYGNKTVVFK
jgi:formyltetrahydrofolate hydrolase